MDTELSEYPSNVATVCFKQNEGSFLAGVLAAKITKKKIVGFIGGMNIPVINDFLFGFRQGVKYIDKNIKIVEKFVDQYSKIDPFADTENGKKMALELIDSFGVDIIYAVSGKTNLGIYEAIKDKNIFAIGVDTDQDYLLPGQILTSMIKNLDTGIIYIVDKIINNNFENKNFRIGLKENGVSLSEMKYTGNIISEDIKLLLKQLKEKIIENKIIIDSVYK
jgi:basic membrane protein A